MAQQRDLKAGALFDLRWPRSRQGYRLAGDDATHTSRSYLPGTKALLEPLWRIEMIGDEVVRYRPSRFIHLDVAKLEPTREGALQFVNAFGFLGGEDLRYIREPEKQREAFCMDYQAFIQNVRNLVAKARDFKSKRDALDPLKQRKAQQKLAEDFNSSSAALFSMSIAWNTAPIAGQVAAKSFSFSYRPASLAAVIYTAIAQDITGEIEIRVCELCGDEYEWRSDRNRSHRRYCEQCKANAARKRAKESTTKICPMCQKPFEVGGNSGMRSDAIYCCRDCNVSFNNARKLSRRSP